MRLRCRNAKPTALCRIRGADMINSGIPDSPKADHRITLAGEFRIPPNKNDPITVPIFSWGKKFTMPRVGGLKYGRFLDQYFGFLACKF